MSNKFSLTDQQIAKVLEELSGPPPRSSMSTWEIVRSMHESLKAARAQGKTLEQMHADVVRCGLDIKLGTFRKYASDLLSDDSKPNVLRAQRTPPTPLNSPSLRSMRGTKGPSL